MANKLFVLYSFIFFTCDLCYSLDQASFYGSSYISIPFKEAKSTTDISFKFRTHLPNALILLVAGTTDFCIVRLENSKLKININLGAGESELVSPPDLKLGDLQWHSVSILRKDANLSLVIDGAHKVQKLLPGRFFELNIHYGLFIGGHGNFSELFFGHLEKFRGCLSQMKYNNMQVLEQARHRLTPSVVESVTWNCAAEFETTRQQAISFVEDNAYMLVTQVVLHKEIKIQFDVKTIVSRGILFYNAGYLLNPEYFLLQIWNNIIQCLIKVGDKTIEVINEINVSDGEWHKISFHQTSAVIEVSVDGKVNVIKNNNGYIFQLSDSSYVGGVEVSKLTRAMSNGCKYCDVHFKGCIRNLYLAHISKGLPDAHATEGLLPGCLWKYPCVQNPCKHDGICVQQGIDSFQCQCEENFCVNQNYSETYKVFSQNSLATDLELLSVNPLEVMEGGSIVLTTANLHLILDYQKYGIQDTGVHFKVIEGPSHGSMTVNVWPQESNAFSLMDVARDKVHYIHDGSEFYQDNVIIELDFTPTDSFILPSYLQGKFTFSVTINIISVNDPPELDISEAAVLRVVQGSKHLITTDIFKAKDPDTPSRQLVYNILKTDSGHFENKQAPGVRISTFTQEDVENQKIIFLHRNNMLNDSYISLQVSDGIGTSPSYNLRVTVTPQYWRLENNTGLVLLHQSYGLITPNNLSFTSNVANGDYKAQFRIMKKPNFGVIEVERNANNWKISEIFTTSDLNQHRVRYRHITSKPDFDEFQFQATVEKSTMYTFRITFVKCSLFEITTKPIFMNETQEMPISPQYLSFQTKPLRTLTTSIYYMIARPPKYGVLLSSVSKYVLKRCDVFTQEDILSLNIKYKLHQKSYSYVQDTFTYVIYSPGCNNITRNMTVIYYPSLDTKSKVGAVLQPLQVEEGSSQNIDLEHLNLKTNFVKNLIFNVTQLPIHGILKLVKEDVELNGTDSFTLRDLANNQLFYVHDDSETNQDLFKFLALSPTDDFQFVGEFNFNIIMKNDNSPVRKIEKIFHIVVGGERLLTGDDLRYSDEDIGTKTSDIVYTCRESPNGYFVNIKDKTGKITDFTQQDLDNHQIIFKHKGAEFGKVRLWVTDGQFHVNGILEVQASAPFIHIQMNRKVIVEYGKTIVITKEHLFYSTNLYANDSDIVYEIISKPSFGKIISPSMEVLSNFTQEGINQGHVSYINDITSANGDEIRIRARCKDAISVAQMGIWMLPSIYWEPFTDKGSKSLQVEESTSSIITKKILEISQINVPSSSITYYISDLPLNGYLTILSNSNNTENDPVNVLSFTQDLINDKRVLYIQSGANQTFDKITFNVTNGIIWYNDVKLRIEIIPERLYLGSKNVVVKEGGNSVITTSNLFILTDYYKRKITDYVILQDASHGCIQVHKRCNKFSGFSQKELLAGVIAYSHDGSENSTDEITVVAVAGQKRSIPVTLMFNITPVNDQLPKLINNTGLVMWEGGYSVITNCMLGATDEDRPKETLAYQVLGSWWGNVVLTSDINTPVTHFTQEFIDKGMVAFHHENGSEAKFKFNISDGSHKTGDYYFLIKTKPVVLKVTIKPLHIFPLQRKYLTTSHLQASLPDVNRTIHYDVIVPPTLGRLMMESSTSGVFKVVSTFTQTDLNNTKLFYEHTHQFSDLYANDSFIFNVKSHLAAPLLNQVLKIDISVSSGGLDSYINIPKITVDEGGITSIRLNLSEVVEFLEHHSGLHAPIIHASSSTPQHGQIYLKENSNLTIFTQQQMESGSVYYEHDHSDSLGDNIHFSLYLIPHYIRLCNITIPVIVNPINDQPFHLVTPAPNLVVVQGENHTITRSELATEDADTPPSKLKYDLITGPSQGNLILLPDIVPITYFTQEDIDQNKLVYVHNSSILKDSFHFRVWDDKFRPQFTVFNIIVIQINLNISPGLPLHLQQGSDVVFLSENQFFIETNADKHKIKYTLKREPKHGVLYVRNIPSLTFTQTDLINESVMFLQSDMTTANDSFKIQGEILSANTSISNEIEIFIKVQPLMQIKNFTAITGEYNKITLHVLDASPLAKLTNSNPRYTILKLPQHGKVKKVIRSSGEKRNVVDSVITSFSHEEVQSGLIYLVVEDVEVPWFGIQDKLVFMLAATIFQPAIGELKINLKYSIHNDIHSTLAGPNDPAGHEGGYHVASPNMTRDYFLIVSMVVGVVILGVAVIVIIKCRSFEPEELNKEEQCLQPIPLPRPPDRLMSSSPRLKHHIDEFSPQLPTLPQCKITPLSRSDLDSQVCYPYGVEEQPDDWSSCDASEPPCPSKNVMLRRNQYWV